tara:strand:+ start:179 stop:412 length:234 start_codon:yes stop_codon:yes gene_type:complete
MAYGNPKGPTVSGLGTIPNKKEQEKSDWEIETMKRACATGTNMDPKKELHSGGNVLWLFVAVGGIAIVYELLKYYGG